MNEMDFNVPNAGQVLGLKHFLACNYCKYGAIFGLWL